MSNVTQHPLIQTRKYLLDTRISVFLFCLFCSVPCAYSQFYESTIGLELANPLSYPQGITRDAAGNLYVVDFENARVQKFNSAGQFITLWGSRGSNDGQFQQPTGIAVDSNGDVYVTDLGSSTNRVQKFKGDGTFIKKWGTTGSNPGQFDYPYAIAVDGANDVYVVDTNNRRVQKFTSNGTFLLEWGSSGPEAFTLPKGIAVDGAVIYVTDTQVDKVRKFDASGNYLGKVDGTFNNPYGIAADANHNVFVSDDDNRVQKFTNAGVFISTWGDQGTDNSQFNSPNGIVTDASGNVYVTDGTNDRVQKFDNDGVFLTKWGSAGKGDMEFFYEPQGVAVDQSGNVYVADSHNNRIQKYNSSGQFIKRWGSNGSGDGQFDNPTAVTVDKNGNVYVADSYNNRIQKFDNDGSFLSKWGLEGTGNGQLKKPGGIATDTDGNVFVVDTGNKRIQKFTSAGVYLLQWGSAGTGNNQFSFPLGISITDDGQVYVADSNNDRIQQFTIFGEFIRAWGENGDTSGQFNGATGVGSDKSGNVYVVDQRNERVQKFKSDGTYVTGWGQEGSEDGQFDTPNGIAIDKNGNAYIADTENNRVQKFSLLSINSFSLPSATPGTSIDLIGTGFNPSPSGNVVKINGQPVVVSAATSTKLTITIPPGATTGTITVERGSYKDISSAEFIVAPFKIDKFEPSIGVVGTTVTISGSGFSSSEQNTTVKFGNIPAEITESSPTSISVKVPSAAITSKISVTISGQTVISSDVFTVTNLAITQTNYPEFFNVEDAGLGVSITVNSLSEVQSLKFKSRGITENDSKLKTIDVPLPASGNTIPFTIPAANFTDRLGLYCQFTAIDKSGNEIVSEAKYTYLSYPATSTKQNFPGLVFGKSVGSYQLISVPLQVDNSTVTEVFNDLGGYNNKKWRLFSLMSDDIKEYPSFTSIQPGQGFWLIVANETEINPGAGHTLKVTPDNEFKINLKAGWNLIGNPYDFTISSEDIEDANGMPAGTLEFKQFLSGSFKNEAMLQRYKGAFVYSDAAQEISVPLINHSPSGGRSKEKTNGPLDSRVWDLSLSVIDGDFRNELFGFGMNPAASPDKDIWDEVSLPLLEGMTNSSMIFKEVRNHVLTKDVVPTEDNYSWQASVSTNNGITLSWDNQYFGDNDKQLIMESTFAVELIDMRKVTSIKIPSGEHVLKFHFGSDEYIKHQLVENKSRLGYVYPNPLRNGKMLSAFVSLPAGTNEIALQLQDIFGRNTVLSGQGSYDGGRQAINWEEDFSRLPAGVYVLKIEIKDGSGRRSVYQRKVIVE